MEDFKVKEVTDEVTAAPQVEVVQETPEATDTPVVEAVAEEVKHETPIEDGVYKVNLDELKPVEKTEEVAEVIEDAPAEKVEEPVVEEDDSQLVELIEEDAPVAEEPIEKIEEEEVAIQTAAIPEGMENLVQFMDETGGTLEDFINLNKDFDSQSPVDLIRDYYKKKYPHYDEKRIERKMTKEFSYDEDNDDPDLIQDRRDAFEDAAFEAKKVLQGDKDKYYSELKFNRNKELTPELVEARDFYAEHKKNTETNEKLSQVFREQTDNLFNDEFKGFDFKVGESKYRFKVKDVQKTKEYQSDLNNFISDFAGEDGAITDGAGYHKALFAAKNADKIAQHFYEQGRADAIKKSVKESKNIDMTPRGDATSMVKTKTGTQFKVVSGDSSNGLRIKMRNKK